MKRLFSRANEGRNRQIFMLGLLAAASLILLAVLWRENHTRGEKYQILFVPKVVDEQNDFWKALVEGAEAGAKEYGAELVIRAADAEDNHQMQADILYQAVKEKPDIVILAPTSYTEVTEAARAVTEAGIPLILVDSMLDEKIAKCVIATDNVQAGKKMAEILVGILPENPVIGIVAHVQGASTALEREEGLKNGLLGFEDCIVGTVFSNSDYKQGYHVTCELLKEHPDINVLAGLNEYSAVGAARAVKDMGLTDQICMVGFDSSLEEIQYLEAGIFEGIVVQKPFNMGYLSVETAVSILQGRKVPEYIDSGSQAVNRETMYSEENQKLLFLFRENQN